jgi:hypothetical protein
LAETFINLPTNQPSCNAHIVIQSDATNSALRIIPMVDISGGVAKIVRGSSKENLLKRKRRNHETDSRVNSVWNIGGCG